MRKIVDYDILAGFDIRELKAQVKERIKLNWQPTGPAILTIDMGEHILIQTMVRYEIQKIEDTGPD